MIFFSDTLVKKTGHFSGQTTFSTSLAEESMLIRELVKNEGGAMSFDF